LDPLHDLSTEALVARARRGCRDSFGVLAERHAKGVYNFLLQRTGSREDAEELCQESLLRAWRKFATYRADWSFSTWVYSIARSLSADRSRRLRVNAISQDLAQHAGAEDHAGELDQREESQNLWHMARAVLDADQHTALWLFYAEDRSGAEIGAILDRSPLAVRMLLFRARATLGRHLEQRGSPRGARTGPALRTRMETTP
jgi:RNA polymerase sigma-70 factor (ECF subfamily)